MGLQTEYNVVAKLTLDGAAQIAAEINKVTAGLRDVTRGTDAVAASAPQMMKVSGSVRGIGSAANDATTKFGQLFKQIVIVGAAYQAFNFVKNVVGGAVREAFKFNAELETTKIGLAAVIGAVDNIPFEQALAPAQQIFDQLKTDAIKSVATTQELFGIYQAIVGPIRNAGYSLDKVREITLSTVSAASALGEDFAQAQRDVSMMVRGTAGVDVKLFSMLKSTGAINENAEEWNKKLTQSQRIEKLTSALNKFSPAAEAYGHSWAGITSTFRDIMGQLLGAMAGPAFGAIKQFLEAVNERMIKNRVALERFMGAMGMLIGKVMVGLFAQMERLLTYTTTHWEAIAQTITKTVAMVKGLAPILLKAMLAAKAVQFARSAGGGAVLAAAASGITQGGAIAAMQAFSIAALPVAAALYILMQDMGSFQSALGSLSMVFALAWGAIRKVGVAMWTIIEPIAQLVALIAGGTVWYAFLGSLYVLVKLLEMVAWVIKTIASYVSAFTSQIGKMLGFSPGKGGASFMAKGAQDLAEVLGLHPGAKDPLLKTLSDAMKTPESAKVAGNTSAAGAPKSKTINDFRGSKIQVKQDFKAADPDRVLINMFSEVNRMASAKTQSAFVPSLVR